MRAMSPRSLRLCGYCPGAKTLKSYHRDTESTEGLHACDVAAFFASGSRFMAKELSCQTCKT